MLLAIDTATSTVGLALYGGQAVLAELTWRAVQKHTVTLMPNLVQMLCQQGLTVAHLTGVAVALGPGSFTGLRVGLTTAKGLALARGLPLVGIPTLDIVAQSCLFPVSGRPLSLQAVLEVGRGRFCVASYRCSEGRWRREGDYQVVGPDQMGAGVCEPTYFCGEMDESVEQTLRERLGGLAIIAPVAARLRRPGYLAQLGWQRLIRGEGDDPATLSPIYLHYTPRERSP